MTALLSFPGDDPAAPESTSTTTPQPAGQPAGRPEAPSGPPHARFTEPPPFGIPRSDIVQVARLVARDPAVQPWARWLIPCAAEQTRMLRGLSRMLVEYALCAGHVEAIIMPDRFLGTTTHAAAVWLDRTVPPPVLPAFLRRITGLCESHTATILHRLETLSVNGPARPHLRLAALVGCSKHAAALLARRHERLDRTGVTAYAQACTVEEKAVLAAAGYTPGRPYQLFDGPTIWPMWRRPAGQRHEPDPVWPQTWTDVGHQSPCQPRKVTDALRTAQRSPQPRPRPRQVSSTCGAAASAALFDG